MCDKDSPGHKCSLQLFKWTVTILEISNYFSCQQEDGLSSLCLRTFGIGQL